MKLLVRNLSRETTETELREMFAAFGTLQSCTLVMDPVTGGSKGFGFVEMPKPGEAKAAIKTLNGSKVGGSVIRVKKAEEKSAVEKPVVDKPVVDVPVVDKPSRKKPAVAKIWPAKSK